MTTKPPTQLSIIAPAGDVPALLELLRVAGLDLADDGLRLDSEVDYWQGDLAGVSATAPLLLAMLRTIILARPEDRLMPFMVARVWLTTHCNACGRALPDDRHSFAAPPYCAPCQAAIAVASPALSMTEQLKIDRDQMAQLLADPLLPEGERSQLYLLSAGGALSVVARTGAASLGRGAVVVSMVGDTQVYYVPEQMVKEKGQQWPNDQVDAWVRDYDPAEQMIVIISRPSGVEAYKVRLAPAEAGAESFMAGPARRVSAA